jgi:hypothetical protein
VRVDLERDEGERASASNEAGWTIGMSFVVRMVGAATFDPALDPTYGMPPTARWRMASRSPSRWSASRSRNVLPPPTKTASAAATARRGSGAAWTDARSKPSAWKRSRALAV